jgi:hypothetical protein
VVGADHQIAVHFLCCALQPLLQLRVITSRLMPQIQDILELGFGMLEDHGISNMTNDMKQYIFLKLMRIFNDLICHMNLGTWCLKMGKLGMFQENSLETH